MKTKSVKQRFLSLLLAIIMVVGMMPLSAVPSLAADPGYTGNGTKSSPYVVTTCDGMFAVADFTSATGATKYIKLGANINVDRLASQISIIILGNCELDLNGYILKREGYTDDASLIKVSADSKVTINDTSSRKSGGITFTNNADDYSTIIHAVGQSQLIINGGTYRMDSHAHLQDAFTNENDQLDTLIWCDDSEAIINDGSFYSNQKGFRIHDGELRIYDGYFECTALDKRYLTEWDNSLIYSRYNSSHSCVIYGGHFVCNGMEGKQSFSTSGDVHELSAYISATVYGGTFDYYQVNGKVFSGEFLNVGSNSTHGTTEETPFTTNAAIYGLWKNTDGKTEYYRASKTDSKGYWFVPANPRDDVSIYSPVVLSATIDGVDVSDPSITNIELLPGEHTLRIISKEPPSWFYDAGGKEYSKHSSTLSLTSSIRMRTYYADYGDTLTDILKFNVSAENVNKSIDVEICAELGDDCVIAGYGNGAVYQNEFHLKKTIKPKVELTGITVSTPPTKTTYMEGESFNKSGMVVLATYSFGSSRVITNYTVLNGSNLSPEQTSVTISYTEGGITKTARVPITVEVHPITSAALSTQALTTGATSGPAITCNSSANYYIYSGMLNGINRSYVWKTTYGTPISASNPLTNNTCNTEVLLAAKDGYYFTNDTTVTIENATVTDSYLYDESGKYMFVHIKGNVTHVHKAGSSWYSDYRDHWHRCTYCNATMDKAAHSFPATWTNAGDGLKQTRKCTVCGYEEWRYTDNVITEMNMNILYNLLAGMTVDEIAPLLAEEVISTNMKELIEITNLKFYEPESTTPMDGDDAFVLNTEYRIVATVRAKGDAKFAAKNNLFPDGLWYADAVSADSKTATIYTYKRATATGIEVTADFDWAAGQQFTGPTITTDPAGIDPYSVLMAVYLPDRTLTYYWGSLGNGWMDDNGEITDPALLTIPGNTDISIACDIYYFNDYGVKKANLKHNGTLLESIPRSSSGSAHIKYTFNFPVTGSGSTVSGTYKSSGTTTDTTTIALYKSGQSTAAYTKSVTGNSGSYAIPGIAPGTYTVKVMKTNHVTREYTVTVGASGATKDVEIWLKGDVNGDGKITTMDYTKTNSHARGVKLMTGYELQCADVVGTDGKVTTMDATRINAHAKGTNNLW